MLAVLVLLLLLLLLFELLWKWLVCCLVFRRLRLSIRCNEQRHSAMDERRLRSSAIIPFPGVDREAGVSPLLPWHSAKNALCNALESPVLLLPPLVIGAVLLRTEEPWRAVVGGSTSWHDVTNSRKKSSSVLKPLEVSLSTVMRMYNNS